MELRRKLHKWYALIACLRQQKNKQCHGRVTRPVVDATRTMTLWHLMTGICWATPLSGALAAAKLSKAGLGGYILAVAVGLALGLVFAWIIWTTGKVVAARIRKYPVPAYEQYALAIYFAAAVWILLGLLVGNWASSAAIRLVF
jgi:hypothetical protein